MNTPLIVLCGFARSGKDSAGAALTAQGWTRRGFADSLKALALTLNPPVLTRGGQTVPLAEAVARLGWETAKDTVPGVRPYLQALGAGARATVADDVWVRSALRCLPATGVVITDCRYQNEMEAARDLGGIVVRVVRPGVGPINGHPSETAVADADVDHEIVNDGTLEQLHQAIRAIANLHFPTAYVCGACGEEILTSDFPACDCLTVF